MRACPRELVHESFSTRACPQELVHEGLSFHESLSARALPQGPVHESPLGKMQGWRWPRWASVHIQFTSAQSAVYEQFTSNGCRGPSANPSARARPRARPRDRLREPVRESLSGGSCWVIPRKPVRESPSATSPRELVREPICKKPRKLVRQSPSEKLETSLRALVDPSVCVRMLLLQLLI